MALSDPKEEAIREARELAEELLPQIVAFLHRPQHFLPPVPMALPGGGQAYFSINRDCGSQSGRYLRNDHLGQYYNQAWREGNARHVHESAPADEFDWDDDVAEKAENAYGNAILEAYEQIMNAINKAPYIQDALYVEPGAVPEADDAVLTELVRQVIQDTPVTL